MLSFFPSFRDQLRVLSLRALSAKSAVGIVDILTDPLDSRIADKFFYRRISKILAKSDRLQKLMQDCPKARVKTVLDVLTRENLNEVEAQLEKILGKWVCQDTEKKKKIVIKDATFKIDVSQFLKTSWKFVRDFFS